MNFYNESNNYGIASIKARILAFILDFFILGLPAIIVNQVFHSYKNSIIAIILIFLESLAFPIGRLIMTSIWGATVGKFILGLKVIKQDGSKPLFTSIILREILLLTISVLGIFTLFYTLMNDKIFPGSSIDDIVILINSHFKSQNYINQIIFSLFIIDFITLIINRFHYAFHDIIAKTYVIKLIRN